MNDDLDLFDKLHNIAYELNKINMKQVAGDVDYLVSWLLSPEWNNGVHMCPSPMGEDTEDFDTFHCPIPYPANKNIICKEQDANDACVFLDRVKCIISKLSEIYNDEDEQCVFAAYNKYVDNLLFLITGEEPEPPDPGDHEFYVFIPDSIVGSSCILYATYDNETVDSSQIQWSVSPPGPIINNGVLTFAEDGEYTITARYRGMIASKTTSLEYKQGWSTKTIVDESGDHPIVKTIIEDENTGNITTQTVDYVDGEPIYTGYEMLPGGESIAIVDGIDTKVKTFDGKNGFSLFFKFRVSIDEQPPEDWVPKNGNWSEKLYTIINLTDEISSKDEFPGISLRLGDNNPKVQVRLKPTNPETGAVETLPSEELKLNDKNTYRIYIKYDPLRSFEKFIIKDITDSTNEIIVNSFANSNLVFNNEITATIGYTEAIDENTQLPYKCRQCSLEVLEFKLSKVLANESEIPTITVDNSDEDKPYLMTQQITTDEIQEIRTLTIVPKDPEQEYVLINEPIITDIKPFADSNKGFEIELDLIVDYDDQPNKSASNQRWTILYMMQETLNYITPSDPWHGFLIRLESGIMPGTSSGGTTGKIRNILVYENSNNSLTQLTSDYIILSNKVFHVKITYDPKATQRTLSYYSYANSKYIYYDRVSDRINVPTHQFNLCLGCALPEKWLVPISEGGSRTPWRIGYFLLKKFSYKVLD